jgi:hypothetical protein
MKFHKRPIHRQWLGLLGGLALSFATASAQSPEKSEALQRQERIQNAINSARDSWRIKREPDKAREVLAAALVRDTNAPPLLIQLAVLEIAQTNHAAADNAARALISHATTPQDVLDARVVLAYVVWDEVYFGILRSGAAFTKTNVNARVQEAVRLLDTVMQTDPGWRWPSLFQIFLALFAGDGPAALRAWNSYYRIAPSDLVTETLAAPSRTLNRLLPTFTENADAATRREVVEALAASRLFGEAAALALQWKLEPDDALQDLIAYARWSDNLSWEFDAAYRQRAVGKSYAAHRTDTEKIMRTQAEVFWKQLHWRTPPKRFTMPRFTQELETRFGAVFRLEYPDFLYFAHRIGERSVTVEQYGRKQVMRFIELDTVVCDGYFGWLSGAQGGGYGGWAESPNRFFEVRTDRGVNAWQQATDPDQLRLDHENLERFEREDTERAKKNPAGYFPGLALRVRLNSSEKLLQSLKAQGLHDAELRAAFIKQYDEAARASLWVAHEGRHVIDLSNPLRIWKIEDLEFRAKLSEIVFAPNPPLALGTGTILNDGIDSGGNAHGRANRRIMKGLLTWLQTHAAEIPALDHSQPLLPQFDRLTDDQMRAAFRSMDPRRND